MPWREPGKDGVDPWKTELPKKKKSSGLVKAALMVLLMGTVVSLVLYVINGYPSICT